MRSPRRRPLRLAAIAAALVALTGCDRGGASAAKPEARLVLAAYSAPREAYERGVIPAFEAAWLARTGKRVKVEASYLASGAQARAVIGGFEADIVALALETDVDTLRAAGLVRAPARDDDVSASLVALAVRPGNPKGIHDFADLARPGVQVLMPDPRTSGGARWNASALWGAALRGHAGVAKDDADAAKGFLRAVLGHVLVMDKGARESMITFEHGVGDVAVTYESEIAAAKRAGRAVEAVIPPSTLVVETPIAIVDKYADAHGARALAEAFVAFARSDEGQRAFVRQGFRSGAAAFARDPAAAVPADAYRIDAIGGWAKLDRELFARDGTFAAAWDAVNAAE